MVIYAQFLYIWLWSSLWTGRKHYFCNIHLPVYVLTSGHRKSSRIWGCSHSIGCLATIGASVTTGCCANCQSPIRRRRIKCVLEGRGRDCYLRLWCWDKNPRYGGWGTSRHRARNLDILTSDYRVRVLWNSYCWNIYRWIEKNQVYMYLNRHSYFRLANR